MKRKRIKAFQSPRLLSEAKIPDLLNLAHKAKHKVLDEISKSTSADFHLLKTAIEHLSDEQLRELLCIAKRNWHGFQIITRYDLLEALFNFHLTRVRIAARLLRGLGPKEAMLYLLGHSKLF